MIKKISWQEKEDDIGSMNITKVEISKYNVYNNFSFNIIKYEYVFFKLINYHV